MWGPASAGPRVSPSRLLCRLTDRRSADRRAPAQGGALMTTAAAATPQIPTPRTTTTLLTDDLLARFAERAPRYDEEHRFAAEDFEELREAGYLLLNVPAELGGYGRNLAEVAREQRRLAYYAAPTALAVNMHLYWTGVAADLWRAGDTSLQW